MKIRVTPRLFTLLAVIVLSGCGDREEVQKALEGKAAAERLAEEQRAIAEKATEEKALLAAPLRQLKGNVEPTATVGREQDAKPVPPTPIVQPPSEPAKVVRLVTRERSLGKLHPGATAETVVVSPDGRSVAYACSRGGKWVVVKDDHEGNEYDEVKGLSALGRLVTKSGLPCSVRTGSALPTGPRKTAAKSSWSMARST